MSSDSARGQWAKVDTKHHGRIEGENLDSS